jgi:integrase
MKGHIRERGKGNWYAVIDLRDPVTGNRKRKWHSLNSKGKREAQAECARIITEMKGGSYIQPDKTTVGAFLERWCEHVKAHVSPKTYERYSEIARKTISPLLGSVTLNRLSGSQIDAAYAQALTSGRRNGSGGLSPRTVHHMHRVLKRALGQAVRWQLLLRNPADAATPPKVEKQEMQTYDLQETATLIEAMRSTTMHVPTLLAVLCGLRRGEIAALRWRNVDLEAGSLSIAASVEQTNNGTRIKPPKSGKARTVALSATMLEELRQQRLKQAQSLLKLGVRLTDDHFVCAHADGSMMQPTYLTHAWVRLIKASGLPVRRLHDLRHAHATHLLAAGVHPKIASERLGHSKVGITLDLYSHVMPNMQRDAAAIVDAALRAAKKQP